MFSISFFFFSLLNSFITFSIFLKVKKKDMFSCFIQSSICFHFFFFFFFAFASVSDQRLLHFRLSARLGLSFVFFYSFCFCNSTRKGGAVRNKSSDFRSILQQAETTLSSLLLSLFCVCVLALMEKSHLYFSILSFALTRSPPPRPRGRTRGLVPLFLFARCINGLRMAKYTVNGSNLPLPLFLLYTHHHPYMREKRLRRKSLICYSCVSCPHI